MRLYVGNIPFRTTEEDLRSLFGQYGTVKEAKVMTDRDTGRPRGFAFVEMLDGGEAAIENLDQTDYGGRNLVVNVAKDRDRKPSRQNGHQRRDYGWD